ncbi:sulfotransferase [Sphingomonas sp. IC-56]|uniref:tetratricopeptide repeat-containing sulfotransferase family protein n=1 Tax=Sphingomonas sp. IC-56 TaxID=2898529 RepID=UPI001E5F0E6B|nr:sulfotransferase [Sphingomonas sp. IC-56]MCD2325222.1 sulfotransferase [Sphingomonas sp. IC-56]
MATLRNDSAAAVLQQLKQALAQRRRHEVDSLIARLLSIDAPLGAQWRGLAEVSRRNGALANTRACLDRLVRQSAGAAQARFERAAVLAQIGDFADARHALAALPAGFPDPATRAHFAGTLALNIGDLEEARTLFRTVLDTRPTSGQTWLSLAEAMRRTDPAEWAPAVLDAQATMRSAPATEQAPFLYALGAAQHALGDHDAAFAAFSGGAEIVRKLRPYDAEADRRSVAQARTLRSIKQRVNLPTDRPIFVFGPPRSGTTLVEQILSSHSAVAGGGEIQLFDILAGEIGGVSAAHFEAARAAPGLDVLAHDYLGLLAARFGASGRVVDKTLNATRYAGLISAILPDAPLVWVRRDPLDNAWSCYRTFFSEGVAWSWDQDSLARHLVLEREMLDFWRDLLGDRLLVVEYEELVGEPHAAITALLAHCGLPPEPAVFTPHKTERAVITASVAQVREPINRKAVGAAEPYRRHLQPFLDAYKGTN